MQLDVEAERVTPLDRSLMRSVGEEGWLLPGGRNMADHSIRLARLRKLEALGLAENLGEGRWRLPEALETTLRAMGERGDIRTMQGAMSQRAFQLSAARLASETGLAFVEHGPGTRIEGVLRRRVDIGADRFALIENGREFMLAPWCPMLERHIDRPVAGLVRGVGIDWSMGRARGIGR
jgi:hypothetical protein